MGTGTEALAVDDAGGNGQYVLDGAAELHAFQIVRPVDAQLGRADRPGEGLAERRVIEMCDRFGVDRFVSALEAALERNRRAMAQIEKR